MQSRGKLPDWLETSARKESAARDEDEAADLPHGWLSDKPLLTLQFEWPDGHRRGFRYIHLDSDMDYTPGRITLRFFGSKPVTVTISGRNLDRVYLLLGDDRWRILRQQARDFAPDGETYISTIEVCPLDPAA